VFVLIVVTPIVVVPALYVEPDFDALFGDDNEAFRYQYGDQWFEKACQHPYVLVL
jgi:hypothetical protein